MKPLVFAITVVLIVTSSSQMPIEDLEDILDYSSQASTRIEKRDTSKQNDCNNFIEEKLIEHGQALGYLVKVIENNEKVIKQLVENLSKSAQKSKLPEEIEIHKETRRHNAEEDSADNDSIIFRIGKRIPKYGTLFKNVILNHFEDRTDPMPFYASAKL
ncbi:uncharacterized protein LOC113514707 [Galleria mellonella]|uniref:Uncharacterized protein LOC113514707 n=1 Tax=Galleria mellonella TaxID=7137 RepID=A0ABM3MRU0_GALME|nr:uncharacterized protein LOC113514707 [Galleria mellonella]